MPRAAVARLAVPGAVLVALAIVFTIALVTRPGPVRAARAGRPGRRGDRGHQVVPAGRARRRRVADRDDRAADPVRRERRGGRPGRLQGGRRDTRRGGQIRRGARLRCRRRQVTGHGGQGRGGGRERRPRCPRRARSPPSPRRAAARRSRPPERWPRGSRRSRRTLPVPAWSAARTPALTCGSSAPAGRGRVAGLALPGEHRDRHGQRGHHCPHRHRPAGRAGQRGHGPAQPVGDRRPHAVRARLPGDRPARADERGPGRRVGLGGQRFRWRLAAAGDRARPPAWSSPV